MKQESLDTSFVYSPDIITLKRPWMSNCVACSPNNPNSLSMTFKYSKSLQYTFSLHNVPNQYSGFDGFVHGGIIATLLDEVAGWTMITSMETAGFTKQVSITYHRPVPTETELLVLGHLRDRLNTKEVQIRSSIYLLNGTLLAEMDSLWYIPSLKHLSRMSGKSEQELAEIQAGFKETIEAIKVK